MMVGAALAAGVAAAIVLSRSDTVAAESESTLITTPASPRPDDRITVEYHPAVLAFKGLDHLTLRGRLRTAKDVPYGGGRTRSLGTLSRGGDGVFHGSFLLPDSVVFVALAVEDTLANSVDDRDGRLWEVLVHDDDGEPSIDALVQRENDFMGRSWDEAYATARLNAKLHPQSLAVWSDVEFFERALFGDRAADSLANGRSKMLNDITNRYRVAAQVPAGELGILVWRSFDGKDTAALQYWYARLNEADPRNPQIAQIAAAQLSNRYADTAPRRLLNSLEILWSRVNPVYGPGRHLVTVGQQVARKLGDAQAYQRWVDRSSGSDSLARTGIALVGFAPTRDVGMQRIRAALHTPPAELQAARPLSMNQSQYALTLADRRRELLGALGEALLAEKKRSAGLDTLSLAIRDGWNLELLKHVAALRREAGDVDGSLEVEARISVDPRTSRAHADSISRVAVRRLGGMKWTEAKDSAEREIVRETMSRSILRTIRGDPTGTNELGQTQSIKKLIQGKPSVIVYWSRQCVPALQSLAAIDSTGRILRKQGVPVYLVADEAPSPEAARFFREHKLGIPVLYDSKKEINSDLRNFGTPVYYVLDPEGRVRFNRVQEVNDLLVQIRAISPKS
jgi:hypothetical protein